ncbi:MAG: hypothetical protein A2901_05565 [Elusimicrobia bacterium RIFCSPLOWO2_01_FULL_54_10]|nr:MAG: hypothetical protein A2901_05565 [Elusimicrobia bacterium RIFCSPLOWO2_01_FULL_54_10]
MFKVFTLALLYTVFAQPCRAGADELEANFNLLDKNTDGKINPEEIKVWGWPSLKFQWADLNDDGFLSYPEFTHWLATKRVRERMKNLSEAAFKQMDADRDGRISYRLEAWCTEDLFRRMDINKDGYLSRAEAFRQARSTQKIKVRYRKDKTTKK